MVAGTVRLTHFEKHVNLNNNPLGKHSATGETNLHPTPRGEIGGPLPHDPKTYLQGP